MALSVWGTPPGQMMRQMMRGSDDPFWSPISDDQLWAPTWGASGQFLRAIPMDIVEKPEGFEVSADLPGIPREAINVEVDEGNVLRISVKQEEEKTVESGPTDDKKWHRTERSQSYRSRAMRMPDNADLSKTLSAKMENGVLQMKIGKKVHYEPKQITIE